MGKQTNGGSKGSLQTLTTEAMKARSLLTKGEKLIILRNALFDDDEGGYGAERDVTRWLAPAFRSFKKNGLDLSVEFGHGESLMGSDLGDLISLAETFAEKVEVDAGREYHQEDKEEHLTEDAARFLIVRDNAAGGKIVAFAHFRFTLHGELADQMEGEPCVFVYDVHVSGEGAETPVAESAEAGGAGAPAATGKYQRKGVAKHLLTMLELIGRKANMSEMLVPVPNSPLAEGAKEFLLSGLRGWAIDGLDAVAPKTARALSEDGSLDVFMKELKPRAAENLEAAASQTGEVVAEDAEAKGEENKEEDDWAVASPAAGATPKSKKSGGNKKGKNGKKKGGSKQQQQAAAEPASSPGSSADVPLVV